NELSERNSFIQTVMDNLPIGIAVNNSTPPIVFEYMNDNFPKIYRTTRKKLKTPDAFWDAVYEDPQIREDMKKRVLDDVFSGDPKRMRWDDLPLYKNGKIVAFVNAMNIPVPDRPLMISLVWDVTETRQRDMQYNSIIQATQDAFWYVDMQSNIIDVNEAACNMSGYSREELLKMKISQISPTESDEIILARIQKIKSLGKDLFEVKHRHKNGTLIDVELSISYLDFHGGRMIAFARDLSERKKAEERLRHAYQIINESRIVAFIWKNEENWPISFVSENVKRLWGYKVEDFLSGKVPYTSIVYPEDLNRVEKEVLNAGNNPAVTSFEHEPYRIITSEGKIIWISDKTEIIRDENGNIIQYQGVIEDISEKKMADEAIHSYVLKIDNMTRNLHGGILMINMEQKIEFVNPSLLKIFSVEAPPDQIIGKDINAMGNYLAKTFKNPEEFIGKTGKIVKAGKKIVSHILNTIDDRYLEMDYVPVMDDGSLKYHLWIFRDITALHKIQGQAIVQDRLASIEELASGLAHEINNPLTGIIGFSELLLAKEWPEDVREDLLTINRQAQRTAKIVKSLLTFARKQTQEKLPVDINKDLQEILDIRTYKREADNINVIKHLATELPVVKGNSSQLKQVYLNLISNADFFMYKAHGKGTLTITTEHSKGFVRIIFADDGPGISKKNLNRIFEPFFTTKEVGEGTGLGLSISKGIIEEHGGSISVESRIGKGSTFTVELPV
ncbi:MAG: PAS domain S-box protein, partial [Peptococcaceae bacterium]